ncbi:hypothetical protein MEPL12_11c00310 [Melissococcus plutonius]|nr:hypothetical protein MEPL12_11c00310 [Melissococcus plutonius]
MKITVYFKNFITFNIQCTFNKINIFLKMISIFLSWIYNLCIIY